MYIFNYSKHFMGLEIVVLCTVDFLRSFEKIFFFIISCTILQLENQLMDVAQIFREGL